MATEYSVFQHVTALRSQGTWRLCFRWQDGEVLDVEIVDYH